MVFTVLFGQKTELNPIFKNPNVDYVCFADTPPSQANGWDIRLIEPVHPEDLPRSSRHPKILTHEYLPEYSRSIYVDSSVEIIENPETLWSRLVPNETQVFGAMLHSFHKTLLEEISAISQLRFEDTPTLARTVAALHKINRELLFLRPVWGGVLAKRHNHPTCVSAMKSWFELVKEFSRRDQVSLPVVLSKLKISDYQLSDIDNLASIFHKWPVGGYVKPTTYSVPPQESPKWFEWINHEHIRAVELINEPLVFERDSLLKERDSLTHERNSLLHERDSLLHDRIEILESNSWKVTRPLRALSKILKGNKNSGPAN